MDMVKILRELDNNTLLGVNREKYFTLMMTQVYAYKSVDLEGEDLDDIMNEVLGPQVK